MNQPHILHIDMDAFFVSVELLDQPHLVGREVIVGHPSKRGVVTSASYEARKYGVRSAMPMTKAVQLCPQAVIIEPHRHKYVHYSQQMMRILRDFSPQVEALSIDEAFVDISGAFRTFGTAEQIGQKIRAQIKQELNLSASVGISDRKFIAKIASDAAKPNGLLVIHPEQRQSFLRQLPVSSLWGVGGKTQQVLDRYGIQSVAQLAEVPRERLIHLFGKSGQHLHDLAHGRDARRVETERVDKSISTEQTFELDLTDAEALERKVLELSHKVAYRLRNQGYLAGTVGIKVKYSSFKQVVRSLTLQVPTDEGHQISHYAKQLLRALQPLPEPVRLLGVRTENFTSSEENLQLGFDEMGGQRRQSEVTMDRIRKKYPDLPIGPASLLRPLD